MIEFARVLGTRLRNATTLRESFWVSAIALAVGAGVARLLIHISPAGGSDVATAKELGISSISILAGHSKSADSLAYVIGLAGAIITSVILWTIWALWVGRGESSSIAPSSWTMRPITRKELALVVVLALAIFGHFWNARAATFSSWSILAEEGELLAWVNTLLRGGVLSRDTFCLYGPLSIWPVAVLFSLVKPSIALWRYWIFTLNALALVATYLLLRGTTRTKVAAGIGAIAVGILCAPALPAMSWSPSRVGLGLAAFAALNRAFDRGLTRWWILTGALSAVSLLYSQEVGVATILAVATVFVLQSTKRFSAIGWTTLGLSLILVPATAYLVAKNALSATIENLFLFPRIRMLGFAASPFPSLVLNNVDSLRAYFVPAVLVASAFLTTTRLLRGIRDARVITEASLFIFTVILFGAALSRPDDTHFAFVAPPAIVLLTGMLEEAFFLFRSRANRVGAIAALAVGFATIVPWASIARENFLLLIKPPSGRPLDLPRGGSALVPDKLASDLEGITRAIQSRTAPDEPFYAFPNEALLYFLADRPQPTHFPLVLFAVTRQQREQLVSELEHARPAWAVVYRFAPDIDGIPYSVAAPEVIEYLARNYYFEKNVGPFALLRRNP